jgi:hypothetical protein
MRNITGKAVRCGIEARAFKKGGRHGKTGRSSGEIPVTFIECYRAA